MGVVVGDRRLHAVGRRLLKRERLLFVKVLSQVAGKRDGLLPRRRHGCPHALLQHLLTHLPGRCQVGLANRERAAGQPLHGVEPDDLHVDVGRLAGLQVELALVGDGDRAAEILGAHAGGHVVHDRAGHGRLRPADLERVGLEEPRKVVARRREHVPLSLVGADHEDVADRVGKRAGAEDVVGAADHAHARRRCVVAAVHADVVVGIGPPQLAARDVVAGEVGVRLAILSVEEHRGAVGGAAAALGAHAAAGGDVGRHRQLAGGGWIVLRRTARRVARDGELEHCAVEREVGRHRHVPAGDPAAGVARIVARFLRLLTLVVVGVGPDLHARELADRKSLGVLLFGEGFEPCAELVAARSEPLVEEHGRSTVDPAGGDGDVEPAVAGAAEPAVGHALAAEHAHARGPARLFVELPLAAAANKSKRIDRRDRSAERPVGRRPEELADEYPICRGPAGKPLRPVIQLRRPEHALRIEPQAAHEPHAGGIPGAEQRPAALLADRAERLACRIKHFHDVIGIAYGHVNRAVGADRDRLRGLQPRDHRLRGAVGSQPQHAASATDHKHAAIRPRLEITGIFHSDLCHFVARRRVEHPHAILGGEVELAADHVEAREARLDRQAGGVFTLPRTVVALLGIDTVDHRLIELVVVDIDDAVGHRDVARAAEAAPLVPPLHVALEVGADDRLPRLRAGPAQNHRLAIGGHGAGIAVVAAPVAAGRIEGGLAGVVGPAHQPQADPLVVDRIPGVAARLHDLARLQVALVSEAVPEQLVRAAGEEVGREQLPYDAALGILDVERDVAVLRHVEGDLREALHLLGLEEPRPIDRGPAVPHRHGKLPSVGKLQLLRLDLASRCKRADAPAAECLEGEDAVRGDARPEDVFERDAKARRRVEVGLDREDDPAAGFRHDAAVDECLPWQGDLLHVALAVGIHREGLLAAERLGVFNIEVAASLLLARKGQVDHVLAIAVAPGRDPADGQLSHLAPRVLAVGVGDDP